MSLAPERNGYFYLLGSGAAAGKDPHAVGMEMDKLAREHFSNSDSLLAGPRIDATVAGQSPPWLQDIRNFCDPRKGACLNRYLAVSNLADLEQGALPYLKRYARLIAYTGYKGCVHRPQCLTAAP